MRPAMLSNNDFTSVYSGYNYSSPKTTTSYQRPIGYSFKNETPKSSTYSSRLKTDNLKTAFKTEKISESPLERRSTPTRDYSASRLPSYSTASKGFYDSDKSQDDRSFYESYKASQNAGQYSPYRNSSATPLSRSTYLKDDDSPILTRRKLDMDFDLELDNPSSYLRPSDSRPSTAKNKDRFEDFGARRTPNGYSHVEDFVSKYKTPSTTTQSKLSIDRSDPSPRGYSLNRPGTSSSTNLMASTLRSSLYADSANAQSSPNIKKMNNFFDAQNNSNNETTRPQKFYSNMPSFEYKKYDEKDASELMASLNKPLLTRSEMNLLKTFEKNASSPSDNKGSSLYGSRFMTKSIEPEDIQQPRQSGGSGEKSRLDSYVTRVDRGATFLTPQKSDDWYGSRRDSSSYYESEISTGLSTKSAKESPFKLSHSLLDKESRFFKDNERQTKESSYKAKETTTTAWNGRSTRASSTRHDESDDSSPEDKKNTSGYTYYMTDMKRHLKRYDSNDYFSQIYREHFQQTFQALKLCKFMRNTDFRTLASKKVYLTKKDIHRNKKTLIFDLDETLIHCVDSPHKRSDIQLNIKFPDGERMEAGINIRPYALECLRELSQYYEVMVFTASHKCYATAILDYLDPHKQYIQHRLFRDSCVYTDEGVYVKDLRILANRDLNDVILVDNAAYSFGFQLENGVPIIPFYENKNDQELKHLTTYLKMLSKEKNLREVNKRTFKLHLYTQYSSQEDVKNRVFA